MSTSTDIRIPYVKQVATQFVVHQLIPDNQTLTRQQSWVIQEGLREVSDGIDTYCLDNNFNRSANCPNMGMQDMFDAFLHWLFDRYNGRAMLSNVHGIDGALTDFYLLDLE